MYLKKESRMVRCEQWNVRVGLVLLEQFIGCADLVFLLRLCTNSIYVLENFNKIFHYTKSKRHESAKG
jgi:hypothetical protein